VRLTYRRSVDFINFINVITILKRVGDFLTFACTHDKKMFFNILCHPVDDHLMPKHFRDVIELEN
jgi:hypothetical protein